MKSSLAVSALIALAMVGCGKSPTDVADMRNDIQDYLRSENTSVDADGEKTPIDLSQGYAFNLLAAVKRNQAFLAAVALEREALAQRGVALSLRRPQVAAGANVGAVRELGNPATTNSGIAGGINVAQLIYDGGASASAVNRATALALAAQADRISQANEITVGAARAWIDFWQYAERLRLMHHRTSEMATLVDQIERMASNGLLDRASLDSARRQIVDIELEEARLRTGQAEAAVLFQRFFGVAPTGLLGPHDLLGADQARALAQDWRNAPVLQRQAAEMLAAYAAVDEAEAAFRPRARLQAGARSPMDNGDPTDLTLGLSVEYTLGDGGRRQMQLVSAQSRYEATVAQLMDAQKGLQAELESTLARLASMDRSIPLLQEKLSLSRSEAETSRSQLSTGQSNLRQLVEAEIEIYRAQDQRIALEAERQVLLLTIAARTGALSGLVGLEE